MFSLCVKYPANPPANVSPAPVGSNTSSSGNAERKHPYMKIRSMLPFLYYILRTHSLNFGSSLNKNILQKVA
jgi:hypothetical protein